MIGRFSPRRPADVLLLNSRRIAALIARLRHTRVHRTTWLLAAGMACALLSLATASWLVASASGSARALLATVVVLQLVILDSMARAHRRTRRQLNALEHMVESDPATGCLNRRGFARALDDAIAAALPMRRDVALLALDLDHFKAINDLHGHIMGDAVLSAVAAQLAEAVGDEGVVARLGGEEFAVLLPHADAEDAGVMAERLLAHVRALRIPAIGTGPVVTMSVGIAAERVISARDASALRARADEALYAAKRSGRDRIRLWASGVRSHATPAWSSQAVARDSSYSDSARPR